MKKTVFTTFCLLFAALCAVQAQDFIVLKTGVDIKSKIEKLTPTTIEYKAFDNLDGPTIAIERNTVLMLRYANGKTEIINAMNKVEAVKPTPSVVNRSESQKVTSDKNAGFTGTIFLGGALPLGSYASKDFSEDKSAGAKLGFAAGLQIGYRFNKNLSALLEGQYALNAYEGELKDVRYIYTLRGDWTHISILPSLRAEMPVSNGFSVYGMASAGVAFSSLKGDYANLFDFVGVKTKATSFAYGLTVGCVVAKHVNIGLRYIAANPAFEDYKPTVSNLQATVGYQF